MHFSLQFRKILLSNYFYIPVLILASVYTIVRQFIPKKPIEIKNNNTFYGTVTSKKVGEDYLLLETNGKIPLQVFVTLKEQEDFVFKDTITVGSKIAFQGEIERIQDKTSSFYVSSYAKYLENKNIFYRVTTGNIQKIKQNSLIESIKEQLHFRIEQHFKTSAYLKTFLLGEQNELSKVTKQNYQTLGISHLFALSGMHISFLVGGLYLFLKKIMKNEKISFYLAICFLVIYYLLVKQSPSILRACLFFVMFEGNKVYDLHIRPYQILLFLLSIFLLLNPYILGEVSFLYSFSIASGLILYSTHLQSEKKILTLLKSSLFSFMLSLPITLYVQNQLNPLSVLFNLFYIPFISSILFPLSFLVFLFPFLEPIYSILILLLEGSSKICVELSPLLTFPKISIFYFIFLFLLFLICLRYRKVFIIYILVFFLPFLFPYLKQDTLTMIDVGQGDCFLFESKGNVLLLDTGGIEGKNIEEQDASNLIQELKARGISKVEVALSHGDLDHSGNLLDLMKQFKVSSIFLNLGNISSTEKKIIALAQEKHIPTKIMKKGESFVVGNFQFLQINDKWDNENDSSSIYFVVSQNRTMLFLGDASKEVEEKLMETYDFPHLALLKVAHHGSNTSTSDALLKTKVDIALISVGRNNRYHHPSDIVIQKLKQKNIKIYQSSQKGSVEIKFPTLNIKTSLEAPS